MSFFDDSHIRQVIAATNIVELVGRYVALKQKGKDFVGLCPFHDDHSPSMYVSPAKQIFKCFVCGAGGDAIKFLQRREQLTFPEAVSFLAQQNGVQLPERKAEPTRSGEYSRKELEQSNVWVARLFRSTYEDAEKGQRARSYVDERGLTDEIARKFGLGWAPPMWDYVTASAAKQNQDTGKLVQTGVLVRKSDGSVYDRFRERLIFPVIDALGRVIAFGGRTLGDDPAKYLNSPESALFNKSQAIYGLHLAKDEIVKQRTAIVVEGYLDCIMSHQFDVANVVATLGTALTPEHAKTLSRYADKIILLFDPDEAGQKAADRALEIFFAQQIEVRLASLPTGLDPSDFLLKMGREAFLEILENATDALEYKWTLMLDRLEKTDTVAGRKQAIETFLSFIANAMASKKMDVVQSGLIINDVAKLLDQPASMIRDRFKQLERQAGQSPRRKETVVVKRDALDMDNTRRAQQEILEVLLNRPEMFEQVNNEIMPQDFGDPVLEQIASTIWRYCEQGGRGQTHEIISTIEDVTLSDLATDMAERGSKRENYDQTIAGALEYLKYIKLEESRKQLREQVTSAAKDYGKDVENALLMEIQAKMQNNPRKPGG